MSAPGKPSLVWPANPADPDAGTSLTLDDLLNEGGAAALRGYLVDRFTVAEADDPGTAKAWSQFAINHLAKRVGDESDDGVEVGKSSVHMILAYVAWLETDRGAAS